MFQKIKNWLNTNNHLLWVSISALMIIGLISAYFIGAYESARIGYNPEFLFNKYWPYALVGLLIMIGFSRLSKQSIIRISWVWLVIGLLMMLSTLIMPMQINGSARYVRLLMWIFDPFVLTIPAYIVLMSHWLSKKLTKPTLSILGMALLTLFIVGTAILAPYVFIAQVYALLFIFLTFKARKNVPGLSKAYIIALIMLIGVVALAVTQPHVQARLVHMFYHPQYSQVGISIDAIKHSALIGNTPESLRWLAALPESSMDFVFTGILAKFGILMGLLVLALYGCAAKGLISISKTTKDKFKEILANGTLGLLVIYVIMSIANAFGVFVASSYLPFVGYANMTLLAWCALFGFVMAKDKIITEN